MKHLLLIATLLALAGNGKYNAHNLPMYCGDKIIIKEGDSAQKVLMFCGEPDEIIGSEWVYVINRIGKYQASYWFYLTFDDGVIGSIERN